ncbi:glycoside hydrolase family 48 protein [Phytoactinopolyspora halotolerans]|uniref:Cellulose 1,4-beta-cellobiosidase n=1 Tax=Phytoactinopolyspora halotolerans TaxID=1981512 RepID=A0A6L9SKR4_9ACTN|nr:glycoside hydrolase family 48 protein [Phytoactinopolyspora halotolerans]NEE04700.1 cellulose 1,4-beta-cellobiosidase [Phytoactinopolyspora halotolerans]
MTRLRRRRTAAFAAGVLVAAGMTAVPSTSYAALACDVDFSANEWGDGGGGFTASLTLTNLGDPLDGWELTFALPGGAAQLSQGWGATWSQDGRDLTAQNLAWNGDLGTGEQASIGFNGTGYGGAPAEFFVNGTRCGDTSGNEPPTVQITEPVDGAEFAAPADVTVAAAASDPDGEVTRVEFYRNGLLLGEDDAAPYQWEMADLPAGDYTVQAVAYDDASPAASAEDEVGFTVTEPAGPAVVASTSGLSVPEGGEETFTLRLSEQPEADVAVDLAVGGDEDIDASPTTLTFTSGDWDDAQTVTVTAAQDDDTVNGTAEITASAAGHAPATVVVTESDDDVAGGEYVQRFLEQYDKIKNQGYFSPEGVPYHSIETLIVEAPDHGHETTSEAFSYWLWLEASYGRVTGEWDPFNQAWQTMEQYIIPGSDDQPGAGVDGTPQYAAEHIRPDAYPSQLDPDVPVGEDPLRSELQSTYGTGEIYGMHWLLDVDNTYGFGHCGDGTTRPSYINTFQRGPQESVWETVPHPSCETQDFGGENGYLDLFIAEENDPATQWRYTNAPDADARAVQVAYWAQQWASEQGNQAQIAGTLDKAAMMGDYLRYAMFDKYFKQIGDCVGASECPAGTGKDSAHYLMSWYYAWGGSYPGNDWSWRIGSSHNHFGYQNPVAAWALVNEPALAPSSPTAEQDWENSLDRQIEFYRWLQSAEGGIAGGATNSWEGHYGEPPAGTATFYGMFYDEKPVYHDPPSNQWFGFQVWSMQRVAEYYWITGDEDVRDLLDAWVAWAVEHTTADGTDFEIPAEMSWSGQPEDYDGAAGGPGPNPDLHATVEAYGQDVGVAASLARTLMWYAAATDDAAACDEAKNLIDALYAHRDEQGVATVEVREDYERFDDVYDPDTGQGLYIPEGWSGQMPNGDVIEPGVSFLDIRSFYLDDPQWPKVQEYLDGGDPPEFIYHRFWAQVDVATAFADYAYLFGAQTP